MSKPPSLLELRPEYQRLWDTLAIRKDRVGSVDAIVARIVAGRQRYEVAASRSGVPWWFIAVVHSLESSGNFRTHLHNGDSLGARTINVPKGRPIKGTPPFSWEESAADALAQKGLGKATDWSVAGALYQLERFNGWGYRLYHVQTLSPYLWSYSKHYGPPEAKAGKYVADGKWNGTAVSQQCGAAVLLKRMHERGIITIEPF